ncbi:MAG TPA: acetate uptake transporter [Candidatus Anoxymicrobiaceae bacterium]
MADDIKLANPAVLGLTCFGITTVMLNVHNAGIIKMDPTILGLGLFVGGLAQIIAGIMEFRKGNTFGTTAFLAYGAFWMTLVFWVMSGSYKFMQVAKAAGFQVGAKGLAWYLLVWGIFTLFMTISTFKVNRVLQYVFISLTVLFILLAIGFGWGNTAIIKTAGVVGITTGLAAMYLAQAELVNETYDKTVLPIWPMKADYKNPEDL